MQKILLVDDEKLFLDAVSDALLVEMPEIAVLKAYDGKSAWQVFQSENPDLVITDYKMPKWNGVELVREIRKTDKSTPVLLITGFERNVPSEIFNDVLYKPFNVTELIEFAKRNLRNLNKTL